MMHRAEMHRMGRERHTRAPVRYWSANVRSEERQMVAARQQRRYTPAEYLALERLAETKSEYVDGCIVAMTDASRQHNRIAMDTAWTLNAQVQNGPCEVFCSAMRVGLPQSNCYTYPDVVVVCGEHRLHFANGRGLPPRAVRRYGASNTRGRSVGRPV
jgi:hypothetical protein